jgi:hypothetical protein
MRTFIFIIAFAVFPFVSHGFNVSADTTILSELIHFSSIKHKGIEYDVVEISRKNNTIKSYYMPNQGTFESFAARYSDFKQSHPNIVAYTSGGFMMGMNMGINERTPEGLTIDQGLVINERLGSFDALVIIYPSGAMAIHNLEEDNIETEDGKFKIRSNLRDLIAFKTWAKKNRITVFQTFLLAVDNNLQINPKGCNPCSLHNNRFIVTSKSLDGEIIHYMVQRNGNQTTMFDAASGVFDLFQSRGISIGRMIYLESGYHDAFAIGNQTNKKLGEEIMNLLIYYFD